MIAAPPAAEAVTEIQGLYGAFTFPEKLLQKIWLRGAFQAGAARTTAGERVEVLHPGKWNLLGGPDFLGARLRFGDGPPVRGDVEVHLRGGDWEVHGHASDPAYAEVCLHVVLFPPSPQAVTRGGDGRDIPVLALLPLLHHDLEEFAADEAVERLSDRLLSRVPEELGALEPAARTDLLERHGWRRWREKVHFAGRRLSRLGWEAACHAGALEVLGYRFNRAAMLRIAEAFPLAAWQRNSGLAPAAYAAESGRWSLQGVRPANHPRRRLQQYASWMAARPDWPARWKTLAGELPPPRSPPAWLPTSAARQMLGVAACRDRMAAELFGGELGGTRLDTLICNALLPLVAAATESEEHASFWWHWFPGDLPPAVGPALAQLGDPRRRSPPVCHGAAQGLLGWLLAREARS